MPRRKKVVDAAEKVDATNVIADDMTENKQTGEDVEKTEEVVKETAEEKAAPKVRKPRAKRGTVKKEVEKKEVAKKETTKKETGKKEEAAQEKLVYIQYAGNEYSLATIEENVKKIWESEGHRASSIKKLDIYIKPEEFAAYYVINGKNAGRIDL